MLLNNQIAVVKIELTRMILIQLSYPYISAYLDYMVLNFL